ncbi:MAG: hypothetical protein OCC49_04860 [Fibrobacterales bacterium]
MKQYGIILSLTGALLGLYLLNPTISDIQESRPKQGDYQYLPNTAYVKTMSMGHKNSIAGLIWIDAMLYFGENILTAKESVWILHLVDLITQLDPQFEAAYLFTGTVFKEGTDSLDLTILKRGAENVTSNWRVQLFYALRLVRKKGDYLAAASVMRPFETRNDIPPHIRHIHRTFQAQGSTTPIALQIYLYDLVHFPQYPLQEGIKSNILNLLKTNKPIDSLAIAETISSLQGDLISLSEAYQRFIPYID